MKDMLLIYADEAVQEAVSPAEAKQRTAAYLAYTEALKQAGIIVGGDRLGPTAAAATVRVANGKTNVLNGPYEPDPAVRRFLQQRQAEMHAGDPEGPDGPSA